MFYAIFNLIIYLLNIHHSKLTLWICEVLILFNLRTASNLFGCCFIFLFLGIPASKSFHSGCIYFSFQGFACPTQICSIYFKVCCLFYQRIQFDYIQTTFTSLFFAYFTFETTGVIGYYL